jgi:hypothetical protein
MVWAHSYENRKGYFNEKVNVKNLAAGVYILRLSQKGQVVSRKFNVK